VEILKRWVAERRLNPLGHYLALDLVNQEGSRWDFGSLVQLERASGESQEAPRGHEGVKKKVLYEGLLGAQVFSFARREGKTYRT